MAIRYSLNVFTGTFDIIPDVTEVNGGDAAPTELLVDEVFTLASRRQILFAHPIDLGAGSSIVLGANSALVSVT